MGDCHLQALAITCPIVRLAKGSSRVFACVAWLRPRCARLTPLTRPSIEPGPWQLRDGPGGSWSVAHRGLIQHMRKEGHR
jgi:hypothetical protein